MEDQPTNSQFCTESTCLNGGRQLFLLVYFAYQFNRIVCLRCLAMNNSILCSCRRHYFGPKCEYLSNNFKTKESCLNNVCKNSGTCVVRNNKGKYNSNIIQKIVLIMKLLQLSAFAKPFIQGNTVSLRCISSVEMEYAIVYM